MIPAFKGKVVLPIAKLSRQRGKSEEYFDLGTNSDFLGKCFFKRVVSLWNTLSGSIKTQQKRNDETVKKKIKNVFSENFVYEIIRSEYGKRCWSNFRFK